LPLFFCKSLINAEQVEQFLSKNRKRQQVSEPAGKRPKRPKRAGKWKHESQEAKLNSRDCDKNAKTDWRQLCELVCDRPNLIKFLNILGALQRERVLALKTKRKLGNEAGKIGKPSLKLGSQGTRPMFSNSCW